MNNPEYFDNRSASIDLCRTLSMLYIAGYWHMVPYSNAYPGYATIYTECIKDIVLGTFTFCSGMVLSSGGDRPDFRSFWNFIRKRFVRIYPLYFLALGLFLFWGIIDLKIFLYSALLISLFNGHSPYTLWFIPMIMTYYLLAPILLRIYWKKGLYLAVSAGIIAFFSLARQMTDGIDPRLIQYLPCFIMGIQWRNYPPLDERRNSIKYRAIEMAVPLLMMASFFFYPEASDPSLKAVFLRIPVIVSGAVFFKLMADRIVLVVNPRLIFYAAYASFCVYLFHRPIILFMSRLYFPEYASYRLLYLIGLVLPAIFVISHGVQRIYDRYIRSSVILSIKKKQVRA